MSWLEVRLTVSGELAEPVAEVLSRHCPAGVVITADYSQNPELAQMDAMTVAGYLPMDEKTPALKKRIREDLWHLSQIQPLPDPTFEPIEEANWLEVWKKDYQPIPIGQRLLIQPPWLEPGWGDRALVRIDPGMAFGTGTHPTTILCLELLEEMINPGAAVVDLGCGSGILSIAAIKLGAAQALAYDTDVEAIKATETNSRQNNVADRITSKQGSLAEAMRDWAGSPAPNFILANILAKVLRQFLEEGLPDLMGAETTLILSGILDMQEEAMLEAAEAAGLTLLQSRQQKDWVALALKKKPAQ